MSNSIDITTFSHLETVASHIAEDVRRNAFSIVLLKGTLGSGKTTFTKTIARHLGVSEEVQSPTYALLREYSIPHTPGLFVHMDLYRVKDLETLEQYGILDLFAHQKGVFFIEWPEILEPWLEKAWSKYMISLEFELSSDNTKRTLTITHV